MDIITILLGLNIWLKIVAITNAIFWIKSRGQEHRNFLERQLPSLSAECRRDAYYQSFNRHQGNFFPFGVKDYKLRSYIEKLYQLNNASWLKKVWRLFVRLYQALLFYYPVMSIIVVVYVWIASSLLRSVPFGLVLSPEAHKYLLLVVALSVLVMNLLIEIEVALGTIVFENYATYFHMLSPEDTPMTKGSSTIAEHGPNPASPEDTPMTKGSSTVLGIQVLLVVLVPLQVKHD